MYTIEYTANGEATEKFVDYPATSYTIVGMNATEYSVRVALNNSAGLSEYSSPSVTAETYAIGKLVTKYLFMIVLSGHWFRKRFRANYTYQ